MKSVFIKDGNFYILTKDKYESIEKFNERGWFVANLCPKSEEGYNEAIRLSRIWINIQFHGCIYDENLMKKLTSTI
jgi:hypothetical protein